jgi:hypothetical protein
LLHETRKNKKKKTMINAGNLILAQSVNTMADLKNAVGHGLGIVVVIGYIYAVVMIVMSLIQERGDGSWKYSLAKGIALFGAVGICNILLAIFYPGQTLVVNFG